MDNETEIKKDTNKKLKVILGLLAFATLFIGAFFAYNWLQSMDDALLPDLPSNLVQGRQETGSLQQQAPNFTMLDIDGNEIQLSDFFGTPIILNFWASWCPSCVREMPYFEALYRETDDEIRILKINLLDGDSETLDRVERFMADHGYTFPIYFVTTGEAAGAYGVRFIPITFFITAEGYVAARAQGAINENILQSGIDLITP